MKTSLEAARIDIVSTTNCLHALAAANHRQWIRWEGCIIPLIEKNDSRSLASIADGNFPSGLAKQLVEDARIIISLVGQIVRDFAWTTLSDLVIKRKQEQLISWVGYARSCDPDTYVRWKLQCRTPFICLTPKQQYSDYAEAVRDLKTIAIAGGLVLVDPLPEVKPLEGASARR